MERAKYAKKLFEEVQAGQIAPELKKLEDAVGAIDWKNTGVGSFVYATKPGDGSAREQAASCQRVLGGWANLCIEYATKRYRSNCVNWGMLPFTVEKRPPLEDMDVLYVPGIRTALDRMEPAVKGYIVKESGDVCPITLTLAGLEEQERDILEDGCLMNYYKKQL